MNRSPARALELLRSDGPAAIWWRALEHTIYRRLTFLARPVRAAQPTRLGAEAVAFSLLDPGETGEYGTLRPDVPAAETRRRIAAGERCLVGRLDGELVHARWFAHRRVEIPYLGHSFELEPGVVYAYDGFTAPAARGLRISAGGPAGEAIIRGWRARSILVAVWPENAAGAGLAARLGYEPIGTVAVVRAGRRHMRLMRRIPGGYLGAAGPLAPGR